MAYPYYNYQPTYYQQPYQPPLYQQTYQPAATQQQTQQAQPSQAQNSSITWVQGEEGAKAYMVAPGNSVLLMDSENNTFYIKSTDASGMPMPLRIYDYTERTTTQKQQPMQGDFVTRQEFDALSARIDALTTKPTRKTPAKEDANG